MNSASTVNLSAAIADDASDEAKLDYYYLAAKLILDDIARRDVRIEKMQEETRRMLAESEETLRKLR